MAGNIYLLRDGGDFLPMSEQPYDSEALLQELLANHPALLAGEQMIDGAPRRWLLISRELAVAAEAGAASWYVDHLYIDQDGIPTLVKKKLTPAKAPLPRFRSDEEAADYFRTHSVADVWNQLPEAKPAKVSKALEKSIRERHAAATSPISIRLDPEQIAAAKKIAAAKSVGYQTQLRMWIVEGIRREAKRA